MSTLPSSYQRALVTERPPWWENGVDMALFLIFLLLTIPETLIGKAYIGPFPIYFFVFYLALSLMVFEIFVAGHRIPWLVRLLGGFGIGLVALGVARGNALKFIMIDTSTYLGLLAGLQWASMRGLQRVLQCWRWWMIAFVALLVFAVVGLKVGLISPSRVSERIYVYSAFRAVFFLAILIPCVWASGRVLPQEGIPEWTHRAALGVAIGAILLAAFIMATRSVLLEGVLVAVLCLRVTWRRQRAAKFLLVTVCALLGILMAWAGGLDESSLGQLGERLSGTHGKQETRWLEVEMLLDQLDLSDFIAGMGFGSQFESAVVVHGSNLALHPHLAVFAFLQKGGIPFLIIGVILPLVTYVLMLIVGTKSQQRLGCVAGALMFIVMASLSSAWEFFFLFFYGAVTYLAVYGGQEIESCAHSTS